MPANRVGNGRKVTGFVSEDDLDSFEGWPRYQGFLESEFAPAELKMWRDIFEKDQERRLASPKVGKWSLRPVRGEFRYAVAIRDAGALWLALWVRRSPKGEVFVLHPQNDADWDPLTSYHIDGTLHTKSFRRKFLSQRRQPLTGSFPGTEHLGMFAGFGTKSVGAICDPAASTKVIEVGPDVLGPSHGVVIVDLIAPGCLPATTAYKIVAQETFKEAETWAVLAIGSDPS